MCACRFGITRKGRIKVADAHTRRGLHLPVESRHITLTEPQLLEKGTIHINKIS
jgi:hypothetical protein